MAQVPKLPKPVAQISVYVEACRASSLSAHSSSGLMLGASKTQALSRWRLQFLEAARLLRQAEALTRLASACLLHAASAPPPSASDAREPAGQQPLSSAPPQKRRRRRGRRPKKRSSEMHVDEGKEAAEESSMTAESKKGIPPWVPRSAEPTGGGALHCHSLPLPPLSSSPPPLDAQTSAAAENAGTDLLIGARATSLASTATVPSLFGGAAIDFGDGRAARPHRTSDGPGACK